MRGLGHRSGVDRKAARARAADAVGHQGLLAIELEHLDGRRHGAEEPGRARLVKAHSVRHAGRGEPQPALDLEGCDDRLDHAPPRSLKMLRERQDRWQRRRGGMIQRIPGIVEVERVRHGAVGIRRVLH
jgi:hypothetical protein